MKTKWKTIGKGEIQRTKGKLYVKTKEEEKLQTKGNERGNMLTIERETIAQSKRNYEIKPKKTQQNLQQGGPKTKKAPTSRRDYFKVFECFSSFALYVVMILFLKISFVLRVQN